MRALHARISINSSPSSVFKALTDLNTYPAWNPWLKDIQGVVKEGELVSVRSTLIGSFHMRFLCRAVKIQAPDSLIFKQEAWFSFLIYAQSEYHLFTKADGRTVYAVSLRFCGPLARLVDFFYGGAVKHCLKMEADALRGYCEGRYPLSAAERAEHSQSFNPQNSSPDLDVIKLDAIKR